MKTTNFLLTSLAATLLLFSACRREENTDWSYSMDNSSADEAFQDVYKNANTIGEGNESDLRNGCAVITHTATRAGEFPDTLTVDFGSGCVGRDGRTRAGVLTIVMTAPWRDAGSVTTITTNNYVVNGFTISGTKTISRQGPNAAGNPVHNIVVTNGSITNPQGETATWNCNRSVEMIAGQSTNFASHGVTGVTDDVFSITGTASGTSRNGTNYTANTTEALIRRMDCRWITDGVVELTPENGNARTIDFGDGTCDNQATVTYRRWSTTITLLQ